MPINSREFVSALKKKGFDPTDRKDHAEFLYPGTLVKTHCSNGATHEFDVTLTKLIATQMRITRPQFENFVNCTFTKDQYKKHLEDQGVLPKPLDS